MQLYACADVLAWQGVGEMVLYLHFARLGPQPPCRSQRWQLQLAAAAWQQAADGDGRQPWRTAHHLHTAMSALGSICPRGCGLTVAGVAGWSRRRMPEWAFSPTPPAVASHQAPCLIAQLGPSLPCTAHRIAHPAFTLAHISCSGLRHLSVFIHSRACGGVIRPASRSDRADNVR